MLRQTVKILTRFQDFWKPKQVSNLKENKCFQFLRYRQPITKVSFSTLQNLYEQKGGMEFFIQNYPVWSLFIKSYHSSANCLFIWCLRRSFFWRNGMFWNIIIGLYRGIFMTADRISVIVQIHWPLRSEFSTAYPTWPKMMRRYVHQFGYVHHLLSILRENFCNNQKKRNWGFQVLRILVLWNIDTEFFSF